MVKRKKKQVNTLYPKGHKKGTRKKNTRKKKKVDAYNIILRNFFILIGIIIVIVLGFNIASNAIKEFEYQGVSFEIVKEGNIIFYQTSLPVTYQDEIADYNFYLRNDPRKLEEVDFDGEMIFLRMVVLNSTEDFGCEGDGIIAIANLVNLYKILGSDVIKNENATCDNQGLYTFLQISEGNETKVEQINDACYSLEVNNCEILESTERFMLEMFVEVQDILNAPVLPTISPVSKE